MLQLGKMFERDRQAEQEILIVSAARYFNEFLINMSYYVLRCVSCFMISTFSGSVIGITSSVGRLGKEACTEFTGAAEGSGISSDF